MSTQQYILPQSVSMSVLDNVQLLYITTAQYSAEWASTPHTHTCAELFFITGGRGSFQIHQTVLPVSSGDLVVVNSGVTHTEISQDGSPMEYTVLGVEGLETLSGPGGYALMHGFSEQRQVSLCLNMLLSEAANAQSAYTAVCQNLLHVILLLLMRHQQFVLIPVQKEPKSSRECSLVRRYIDNHFKENITLDHLAAMAHLNKYYLAHAFQRSTAFPRSVT